MERSIRPLENNDTYCACEKHFGCMWTADWYGGDNKVFGVDNYLVMSLLGFLSLMISKHVLPITTTLLRRGCLPF